MVSNTDQALINGEAIFNVELFDDYSEGFIDGTDFINKQGLNVNVRSFMWHYYSLAPIYYEIPTYSTSCENCTPVKSGTTTNVKYDTTWKEYNGQDLVKGNYAFGS